tara:strand:+ start:1936 stop:3324 length:1389 start_codon:yes stop_codon:yes gene_type:complete
MSSQGNLIAYLVDISWPLIAIWLYRTKSIQVATLWTILGGFMFLPVRTEIDFPLIPPLGKHSIPVLSALIGIWLLKRQKISYINNDRWVKGLLLLFLMSPFITVLLNGDPISIGSRTMPGLTNHDAISATINQWLFVLPLLFGRQFFRTYEQQLLMFKTLVIAGLFYSILMLFEIRMSPQLHTWLYGYFPHSFGQQKRFDGFRPVVFMGHGLWVAFFAMTISLAATTLWKNGDKIRKLSPAMVSYYLLGVLVLCKSMASLFYGLYAYILIRYTSTKTQFRLAIFLVMLALLYPTMSILKVFPHQEVADLAGVIDQERAGSLMFRFNQEAILLEHGAERFFFGWGGWGRNRVFNDETGKDESVTDGRWIITFGVYGWFGFIAEFGLLTMTVFRAYIASKFVKDKKELNLLAAHAILVSLIIIDQLPNASLQPWLWLLAGVLLGRSDDIISKHKILSKTLSNLK